jgi:hypothetical protein
MWNDFPSLITCIFYIFAFFTPAKQQYFEICEMTTHSKRTVTHARDHGWTSYFANAFLSPRLNDRAKLLSSPRAYAGKALHAVGSGICQRTNQLTVNAAKFHLVPPFLNGLC